MGLVAELSANLAAGEVPRAGVDAVHAVVRVDVDVGITPLDGRDEIRERVAGEGADQVGGGKRPLGEDAIVPA
jgi:hypothetical protein